MGSSNISLNKKRQFSHYAQCGYWMFNLYHSYDVAKQNARAIHSISRYLGG
ncbi:hypothetical protein [Vibrio sp. qd031]|uniref:hypothetical protein n=1 Tax=Vibrio sp. qd031 TaxID=1603038 RepID=UPI00155693BB|nr:hypothetical protein [Vibrio sp. qd031]